MSKCEGCGRVLVGGVWRVADDRDAVPAEAEEVVRECPACASEARRRMAWQRKLMERPIK